MRVVVVGGGCAGIAAATRLHAGGAEVVVLEAGARLGGRVRTVHDGFVEGQYGESGGEWVDTIHPLMNELLDRHAMTVQGTGQEWTSVRRWLRRGGRLIGADETERLVGHQLDRVEALLDVYADCVPDPEHPADLADALALDQRSFADVIVEAELDDLAELYLRRNSQGEFAEEPERVSMLFVAQQRSLRRQLAGGSTVIAHRVRGGLSGLVTRMSAGIAHCVALNSPVRAIIDRADGVRVVIDGNHIDADAVIVTCALPALRQVRLDIDVDPTLVEAIQRLGYGTVTKTAVQFESRQWQAGYTTTDTVSQRMYEQTVDQSGAAGIMLAYTGGDGGRQLADLGVGQRTALVEADMRETFGLRARVVGGFTQAWSADPAFGGSYAVYQPGQVGAYWEVLRALHGRLQLAGEHVATWTGYLEGAVESGMRAADRLLLA